MYFRMFWGSLRWLTLSYAAWGEPAANSAPLYWHNDWWAWDDPISFQSKPTMLFVMFYLTNTNKQNGCLRVIPGSHLRYNKVHQHIKKHHSHYRLYNDPNDPVFKSADGTFELIPPPTR